MLLVFVVLFLNCLIAWGFLIRYIYNSVYISVPNQLICVVLTVHCSQILLLEC